LFTSNQVLKHKEVVSNLHVCCNGPGRIGTSYIFHLSTRILTSTHTKGFNFFSHYICRDVQQSISDLDNNKKTCQTISTKVPSKLLLGKHKFTLTYADLEYETNISIWEFEMIIVLK